MRLHSAFLSLATACLVAALMGCGGGGGVRSGGQVPLSPPIQTLAQAQRHATWTILVYLDADNDLESAGIHNFNQMEEIGSMQDVHVIVQMDRRSGTDSYNENWTDTRRYLIIHDSDTRKMNSIRLDDPPLGEADMADPHTLRNFVQWGMNEFPADHYALVIWDHGTGWQIRAAAATPRYKYVVADDTSGTQLNVTQIPSALAGLNLDVIAFDACYMQQLEVAYELRGCARYMVASTAVVPSPGYDYARLLSRIGPNTDPEQLSRVIVEQYAAEYPSPKSNITQSAIDLQRIGDVATAADGFARLLEDNAVRCQASLASARTNALSYSSGGTSHHSIDLLDYASRCATAIGPGANSAYSDLESAINAAVVASSHNSDMPNAHGLAVYVPPPTSYDSNYAQLSLARDTDWDSWLTGQRQ